MSDEELRALAQQAVVGGMPLTERIFTALQGVRDYYQARDATTAAQLVGLMDQIKGEIESVKADIEAIYQRELAVKTFLR